MRKPWTFGLVACFSVILLAAITATSLAGKGGKGGGGSGGGDPPPVNYAITWLPQDAHLTDMNDDGVLVGWYENSDNGFDPALDYAFRYTPGLEFPLEDLNDVIDVDEGFSVRTAASINNCGDIAGRATRDADGATFLYLYQPSATPTFQIIAENLRTTTGTKMNNRGDIAFKTTDVVDAEGNSLVNVYHADTQNIEVLPFAGTITGINDYGQISGYSLATEPYRYTPDPEGIQGNLEIFPFTNVWAGLGGINNAGSFVGGYDTRKFKQDAFRYDDGVGFTTITAGRSITGARGINELGNVCGRQLNIGFHFSDQHGLLNLDDLVTGNADDLATWFPSLIDARHLSTPLESDPTGFGLICGFARLDGVWYPFLLTPVQP